MFLFFILFFSFYFWVMSIEGKALRMKFVTLFCIPLKLEIQKWVKKSCEILWMIVMWYYPDLQTFHRNQAGKDIFHVWCEKPTDFLQNRFSTRMALHFLNNKKNSLMGKTHYFVPNILRISFNAEVYAFIPHEQCEIFTFWPFAWSNLKERQIPPEN